MLLELVPEAPLAHAEEARRACLHVLRLLERAVVLCRTGTIGASLLDLKTPGIPPRDEAQGMLLDDALDRLEREMILRALDETKQVKARAARLLGVSERSLWYKLRKHGLS